VKSINRQLIADIVGNLKCMSIPEEEDPICGVYFLLHEGEIVYVGFSRDIRFRIIEHFRHSSRGRGRKWKEGIDPVSAKRKKFDEARYIEIPDAKDVFDLEQILIDVLKPKYNSSFIAYGKGH